MTRGTLYIVATPIGNAEDITLRARRILTEADIIAAEDTRSAGLLLKALGINNKLISYHRFNEKHREDFLLSELDRGMDVAIVSDAGTPCISDPGGIIVNAAAGRGIRVVPVCGASAVTAALSVCGFAFNTFTFYGFFPRTVNEAARLIGASKISHEAASVFYESPKRIIKTIGIIEKITPDAQLCLCNDLTKSYERIYRGVPRQILDELSSNPSAEKGEYTLVCMFGGERSYKKSSEQRQSAATTSTQTSTHISKSNLPQDSGTNAPSQEKSPSPSPEAAIADYLVKYGGTPKDAVNILSNGRFYNKKELYKALSNITKIFNDH